jgi:hypothetical protein
LHHQHNDAQEREGAGNQLVCAPGQNPIERIDVAIGAADDPPLMSAVKKGKRELLDVLKDGEAHVVHGLLSDAHRAFDLKDGEPPAEQQIAQINRADDQDTVQGGFDARNSRQVAVDPELNEFGAEQLRDRGEESEKEIEKEGALVRTNIIGEPPESRLAHSLLGECFFDQEMVVFGHVY